MRMVGKEIVLSRKTKKEKWHEGGKTRQTKSTSLLHACIVDVIAAARTLHVIG